MNNEQIDDFIKKYFNFHPTESMDTQFLTKLIDLKQFFKSVYNYGFKDGENVGITMTERKYKK
jgi:hypothetical protein